MAENNEKEYEMEEVRKHKTDKDCWIVYDGAVYDVTDFLPDHPGGPEIVMENAGTDATDAFDDIGHSGTAKKDLKRHRIGVLKGAEAYKTKSKGSSSNSGSSTKDSGSSALRTAIVPLILLAVILYFKFFHEQ